MQKQISFIGVLVALAAFFMVGLVLGSRRAVNLPAEYRSVCAVSMEGFIEGGQGDVYNYEGYEDIVEPALEYPPSLVVYEVVGDQIANPVFGSVPPDLVDEQEDFESHNKAWQLFAALLPSQDRGLVREFNVFTDGPEETLAAVDLTAPDSSFWKLEVDIADLDDRDELAFTLIHEYGHLLTLNFTQIELDEEVIKDPDNLELQEKSTASCPGYYTGLGCSLPESYIQEFHTRFWTDIEAEWAVVDAMQYEEDASLEYYNALYDFYQEHRDQFVSDYSVTHPTEDIAESFTHFIFSPKPHGDSIREQKVRFFYEYPELVRLREDILTRACALDE